MKLELEWAAKGKVRTGPVVVTQKRPRREAVAWGIAALAIAVAVAAIGFRGHPAPAPAEVSRFDIRPPAGSVIGLAENRTRVALSPDGRQLAFVAATAGISRIWVRPLNDTTPRPLAGTEAGVSPFWSPDSRFIGFFAPDQGELKKIEATGGPPLKICAAQVEGAPTWGRDNTILFTEYLGGIYARVVGGRRAQTGHAEDGARIEPLLARVPS